MTDTARARKLADRVRELVAGFLEKEIKDPRLGFVTITDTRMTGDLQHATVFYTVYGDAQEKADSAAALESAKGVLRSKVGQQLKIRLTPTLEFVSDDLQENAKHIEDLLRAAGERDAQVAALAQGASYAGEADPYKREPDAPDEADGAEEPDGPDAFGPPADPGR